MLGIGKTFAWRLVWKGRLRSVSIGGGDHRAGRVIISRQAIADFLEDSNKREE